MGNTLLGAEVGLITILESQSNEKRASNRSAVRGETQPALRSVGIDSGFSQQPACSVDGRSAPRLSSANPAEAKQCFLFSLHGKQQSCKFFLPGCRKITLYSFLLSHIPKHSRTAYTQATMEFGSSFKSTQMHNFITCLL